MGFDDGQIILDSENGAYFAGQTVFGRVVFSQGKVKTIHGIFVDIKGFCKVHWTTSHTRRINDRTETYTVSHDSHEEYFRRKTFLFGGESGEHHLQPGNHEFRFDCPIPVNVPSSFEGSYGHIRYRVKVKMLTTGIFTSNKEKMVPIRVHAPLDLNMNPYCKEPIEFELSSTYCCWCVTAGSSQVMVRLPVGGYCPGQVIPMEIACKNESNVEIDEIKFAIKKDVTYMAECEPGTQNDHDTVAEIKKGPIPGHTTRNWTVDFEVPTMDIYNVNASRFIDINYHFKVSTEVSGCHEGTEETHPIIFGTIPLVGFQDNVQNPLQDQIPSVQGGNTYPPPPIINQPLSNSPYPNNNAYPNNSPYPGGAPGYPTTPNLGRTSPYPQANQPYPNASPYPPNQPYPGGNSPYPGANPPVTSPYPQGNSPYPQGNPPYPGGNSPYPGANPPATSPYPQGNSPYPTNTPYSTDNPSHGASPVPPYPGAGQSPAPYPAVTTTIPLKTGNFGFVAGGDAEASVPLLPPGANVPYPASPPSNPYATASAPVPSTPGSEEKKPLSENIPDANASSPPYNPDYMKNSDKKDEKTN
uniref:Arrestin C-terminal-like domain-containing protein n=1 Tax=Heliothis virescens TaxID=7102 RepID=A0A2A4K7M0_HELVI